MKKKENLTSYISASGICQPETFIATVENGAVEIDGSTTANGRYLYWYNYTAVFTFKNFVGDIELLIALFVLWLGENDAESGWDASRMTWKEEIQTDGTTALIFKILFQERVHFVQSAIPAEDTVSINGEHWKKTEESIRTAETLVGISVT